METVKEHIKKLYELRKQYIDESNYIKAEEISKQINDYKTSQMKKQQREFAQKKEVEQNNFERAYKAELFQFNELWLKEEKDLKNKLLLDIEQLKKRQKLELGDFIARINESEMKQKISPNYLNMKSVEETLVKQERFMEAEQIKHQAEKLLKKENYLMGLEYQLKIKKQIEFFKQKQAEELKKLDEDNKKKIYLLQKQKNQDFDKIVNKYRVYKVEIMQKQKDEESRAKKMLQRAFRSGKRSMSQENRSSSNYFK